MPEYGQTCYPKLDSDERLLTYRLRRAMTPAEAWLWQSLRANRLAGLHFRRQQVIAGLIVDFYCHEARLAVEVDGAVHASQLAYDAERSCVLGRDGVRVLRVTNSEVENQLPSVLRRVAAACREAPTPRSPEGSHLTTR